MPVRSCYVCDGPLDEDAEYVVVDFDEIGQAVYELVCSSCLPLCLIGDELSPDEA